MSVWFYSNGGLEMCGEILGRKHFKESGEILALVNRTSLLENLSACHAFSWPLSVEANSFWFMWNLKIPDSQEDPAKSHTKQGWEDVAELLKVGPLPAGVRMGGCSGLLLDIPKRKFPVAIHSLSGPLSCSRLFLSPALRVSKLFSDSIPWWLFFCAARLSARNSPKSAGWWRQEGKAWYTQELREYMVRRFLSLLRYFPSLVNCRKVLMVVAWKQKKPTAGHWRTGPTTTRSRKMPLALPGGCCFHQPRCLEHSCLVLLRKAFPTMNLFVPIITH